MNGSAKVVALYPGSFDPVTNGHVDIILRSAKIFDRLVVGVAKNISKVAVFDVQERLFMLNKVFKDIKNIEITAFDGLLIDFAKHRGLKIIIRGLRAVTDFEYEFQMALTNKMLDDDIETFFISSCNKYSYLSSSIVKEVARFGGNIDSMVPEHIRSMLLEKFSKKLYISGGKNG